MTPLPQERAPANWEDWFPWGVGGSKSGSVQHARNSIRHNLSLHSRFVRIQNEGTGKSSWWMLNPEGGKSGKSPRRRAASMDNNSKFAKSRGRATKKKMALQEGVEGGDGSPGSQYSNWLGSPNSHSNEDFEAWSSFRTRTSSDASTLSGCHSPFPPDPDDLGESEGHMMYPGASGTKITSSLPSLSEVAGSIHGSEMVMEGLLDNLNLLPPKPPQLVSDSSTHSSNAAMLQSGPYSSPGLTPLPQKDYRKCMYSQVRMSNLPQAPMQTLPQTKPGFGAYENQYICPAGLLKELLTSEAEANREVGRGGCQLPPYSRQSHMGGHNGAKMMNPPQSHPHHQRYRASGSVHPHLHHQERLPSDLDNVSIERLECDMETVLHDTLMDGGALDFNFDPSAGFPQRVKTTTHSWVSG
ncbi:Forkhead box protein O1-B [Dissostichus eleginoides]|uniref:Forkhead box protein O1-B n=1 Tax=Dissostichus eleginoides TaxID=100907 RepID=A0AAD9BHY9_DISEL|nr:Forkhead box protein O1-B [Dissostichus eleginoides]